METLSVQLHHQEIDICIIDSTMSTMIGRSQIARYTWYFAERDPENHSTGVAIAVKTNIDSLYKPKASIIATGRILMLRLQKRNQDITIISAYAPGEQHPVQQKQSFWKSLQQCIRQLPNRTSCIVGIDANGTIGKRNPTPVEPIAGPHGATNWNTNGEALYHMASYCNMSIVNTLNTTRNTDITFHNIPPARAGTRIDYILISTKLLANIDNNQGTWKEAQLTIPPRRIDHEAVMIQITLPKFTGDKTVVTHTIDLARLKTHIKQSTYF